MQIISASVEKIINCHAQEASDDIGDPVKNATGTARDQGFLDDLGERSEGNADGQNGPKCLLSVIVAVLFVRLALTPKGDEGEAEIHEKVDHLVQSEDGLHLGENRTRKSRQQQNHRCTEDSRVTISSKSIQREIT